MQMAFLAILIGFTGSRALAQLEGKYEVTIDKKQEEKRKSRWTLEEWLAQKQRNQMMDLWLAKNSHSSLFEFFLEGQAINYNSSDGHGGPSANDNAYQGTFAAYAGIAGLAGGYEGDGEDRTKWFGSFNLRIFGRAIQDTHVNIDYGLQGLTLKNTGEYFQNQAGGVSLDLYLTKQFGVQGAYHHILPGASNQDRSMDGENEQAGVFIDFGAMRVYGCWRKEFLRFNGGALPNSSEFREGFGGGLRLFF